MPKKRSEKLVKKRIRDKVESEYPNVVRVSPMGTMHGKKGVSDLVFCVNGRFLAVEVKAEGSEHIVSDLQLRFCRKVVEAGGVALVTSSAEAVLLVIQRINKTALFANSVTNFEQDQELANALGFVSFEDDGDGVKATKRDPEQ